MSSRNIWLVIFSIQIRNDMLKIKANKNKGAVLAVIGALFVGVLMSFSFTQPKHNFKVLPQDITHDSLMGIMHGFNKALGVKCGFCHAKSATDSTKLDFASDELRHKEFARHMMVMTAGINKDYFNFQKSSRPDTIQVITCVTCHRGSEHPVSTLGDGPADHFHKMMGPDHKGPGGRDGHPDMPPPPGGRKEG